MQCKLRTLYSLDSLLLRNVFNNSFKKKVVKAKALTQRKSEQSKHNAMGHNQSSKNIVESTKRREIFHPLKIRDLELERYRSINTSQSTIILNDEKHELVIQEGRK